MNSNSERGYHPEKTEEITEVRMITPLQRDYLFHREPYMSLSQFGYIAITWSGRYLANFDYYEVLSNSSQNLRQNAEEVMETWVNGNSPNPDEGNKNIFAYRWSTSAIFYKPDNAFTLGCKNDKMVTLLKIVATQNPESTLVSDVSIEPENTPRFNPMPEFENLDLDPKAAAFFDSLEKTVEQSGK
jgi:hypothetical protein